MDNRCSGTGCSQHSVESYAVFEFVTAHSFHIAAQPLTHTVGRFLVFLVVDCCMVVLKKVPSSVFIVIIMGNSVSCLCSSATT